MSSQAMASFNDRVALREGLNLISRVIKLQSAVIWFFRGVILGLVADCALLVAMRLSPLGVQLQWLVLPPAILGVAGLVAAFVWPIPIENIARRADARLGLKERLITAIELQRSKNSHPLAGIQLHDAVEHVRQVEPLDAFPVKLPLRELQIVVRSRRDRHPARRRAESHGASRTRAGTGPTGRPARSGAPEPLR